MKRQITRREALKITTLGVAATMSTSSFSQEKPPALLPAQVKEFVIAGHADLEKVKEMLKKEPGLLNASWDWGGGDFETALEGAGHMGNREIALYLIGKGARMSIFQAAMLGDLEIVKGIITRHPEARNSKGPHGIDLIQHAKGGGAQAKTVLEYLERP
jgi:hypothetical protein